MSHVTPRASRAGQVSARSGQVPLEVKNLRFLPARQRAGLLTGQALIEVLVAISVLTVGFLGIVTLLSRALSLNRVVSDSYTATYLAAEGIEVTKNIVDAQFMGSKRGWNSAVSPGNFEAEYDSLTLSTYAGRRLLLDPQTKVYSYKNGVLTPFTRKITVAFVGSGQQEIIVNSEVDWPTRGGGESSVNLEDHFYNWR